MPRVARQAPAGWPLHVMQRGNNKQRCFYDEQDYRTYLAILKKALEESAVELHAYVLMSNHIHLLLTPLSDDAMSQFMKRLGQRYTQYFNGRHKRSGTLWEGRYKSSLVQDSRYLLTCYRYIELNPLRAGLESTLGEYLWSSFHYNALGTHSSLVTPHAEYLGLSKHPELRRKQYQALFDGTFPQADIDHINKAIKQNRPC